MTRENDRWRLPALERFGAQLREAECAEPQAAAQRPSRWRPSRTRAAAVVAGLALIAVVLDAVTPAGALSPINHAPAAAAQSKTVRFNAVLEVTLNGRRLTRFTQHGELDFATGDYETTLNRPDTSERIERRRIGDVFYGVQLHTDERAPQARWHAIRVGGKPSEVAPAPGGYTLMDPQVIFRVLARSHSPVSVIGHEELDGTPTTHYHLSTSLAAFLAAEQGSVVDVSSYESVDTTLDVWLDKQGRPKQAKASFAGLSRFGKTTMTTLADFTDYGAPVIVRPPSHAPVSPRNDAASLGALGGDPLREIERLLFTRP